MTSRAPAEMRSSAAGCGAATLPSDGLAERGRAPPPSSHPFAVAASRAHGERAIDGSALGQRQVAVAMPDRKRKDRRLGQFFIVEAVVTGAALRRQQAKRWRGCHDPLHRLAECRQGLQAKPVGYGAIGPDLLQRRFPAKPLAEIGPDREAGPQRPPMRRPVAPAAIGAEPRRNSTDRADSVWQGLRAPAARR